MHTLAKVAFFFVSCRFFAEYFYEVNIFKG